VIADVFKTAIAFFVAVVVQATIVSSVSIVGGKADLVLVTLAAVALLRGSIFGAIAGFYAGFLLDAANLDTLGVSSLLLCLAGYWIGATARSPVGPRARPLVSIAVVTVLYASARRLSTRCSASPSPSRRARALPATILLNLADRPGLARSSAALRAAAGASPGSKDVEFG
jgi:rod shape-determining protein MreD